MQAPPAVGRSAPPPLVRAGGGPLSRCVGQEADLSAAGYEELAVGAPPRAGDLDEVAKGILIIEDRAYLAEVVPPALLGRSELAHAPASRWNKAPAEEQDIARLDLIRAPAMQGRRQQL